MNMTRHAHRLYFVLLLMAATTAVVAGPAAGRTDVGRGDTGGVEVDAWASGLDAPSSNELPQPAPVDAWARGGAARSVAYDAWTSGRVRASTVPNSPARAEPAAPPASAMSPQLVALGLITAAGFGAMTAVAVGHRRRTPSAR